MNHISLLPIITPMLSSVVTTLSPNIFVFPQYFSQVYAIGHRICNMSYVCLLKAFAEDVRVYGVHRRARRVSNEHQHPRGDQALHNGLLERRNGGVKERVWRRISRRQYVTQPYDWSLVILYSAFSIAYILQSGNINYQDKCHWFSISVKCLIYLKL